MSHKASVTRYMYLDFIGFGSSDEIDGTPKYSEGLCNKSLGVRGLISLGLELA